MGSKRVSKKDVYWLINHYLVDAISNQDFCDRFDSGLDLHQLSLSESRMISYLDCFTTPARHTGADVKQTVIDVNKVLNQERKLVDFFNSQERSADIEQLFKKNGLDYSWCSLKFGWDLRLLSAQDAEKYALSFLESNPTVINPYIVQLIDKEMHRDYVEDIDKIIKNIFISLGLAFPEKYSAAWNAEWRKWRFCCLTDLVQLYQDKEKLFMAVHEAYADFGYPQDMNSFVYYLQSEEAVDGKVPEEVQTQLVENLLLFLKSEKALIDQGCDQLPEEVRVALDTDFYDSFFG